MKTLYNPKDVDCPEYVFNGSKVNIDGLKAKQLKQFSDPVAEDMLTRWDFLMDVKPEEVEKIIEKKAKEAKEAKEKVKVVEAPALDADLVPIDTPKKIDDEGPKQQANTNGPEFYGPGLTETFTKVPPLGKGHF